MLANSFKFKPAQGPYTNPLAFLNSEISCQCFLLGLWSVVYYCTEYLAILMESRIKCETTQYTSPDILTEKGLTP